ncbi:MAG: hypothetical protein ABUL61_06835, partial [Oleiharenicola lentus]
QFGLHWIEVDGRVVLFAHPSTDVWLQPAGGTSITWVFGVAPGAYKDAGAATNGVEFLVEAEAQDGSTRRIYRRLLNPLTVAADRGDQRAVIPYTPRAGEVLRFSTRPNENEAFDWAYWVSIGVR